MQVPDPSALEARLLQLMPVALSDQGAEELEHLIDRLSGNRAPTVAEPRELESSPDRTRRRAGSRHRWPWFGGAAAAVAGWLLAIGLPIAERSESELEAQDASAQDEHLVLIGETDVVESMIDEGWISNPDGIEMQAVRVQIRAENQLRDAETGIIVKICEPREEMIYLPVTAF